MSKGVATVDTAKFNAMIRELRLKTKAPLEKIIDSEATAILEQTLKWTKAANAKKIATNQDSRVWATVNNKRVKRAWKLSAANWSELKRVRAAKLEKLKRARGLSKRQVANMAAAVGLTLKGTPAYVSRAVASAKEHRGRNNATGLRRRSLIQYVIVMTLKYPLAFFREVNLQSALNRAIKGRVKFFKRNIAEGVFDSTAAIGKKYGALAGSIPT